MSEALSEHVTIKQYVEMQQALLLELRVADQRAVDIARSADQRAQDATLAAMNIRLHAMNESRGMTDDVLRQAVSRKEAFGFMIGSIGIVFGVIAAWGTFNP